MAEQTFSGARLKAERVKAGLTQIELCEKIGLNSHNNSMVSKWERGITKPDSNGEVLPAIAKFFGLAVEDFYVTTKSAREVRSKAKKTAALNVKDPNPPIKLSKPPAVKIEDPRKYYVLVGQTQEGDPLVVDTEGRAFKLVKI